MISHIVAQVLANIPGLELTKNLFAEKGQGDEHGKAVIVKLTYTEIDTTLDHRTFRASNVQIMIHGHQTEEAFGLAEQIMDRLGTAHGTYAHALGDCWLYGATCLSGPVKVRDGLVSLNFRVMYRFEPVG